MTDTTNATPDGIEINLDGVDAWKGGEILPAGRYQVECVETGHGTSAGGFFELQLTWEALNGEHQGGQLRDWIQVTEHTFGKVKQLMLAVGMTLPAGQFKLQADPFKGRRCEIIARDRPKPDGTPRTEVQAYEPLSSEVTPASANAGSVAPAAAPSDEPAPF